MVRRTCSPPRFYNICVCPLPSWEVSRTWVMQAVRDLVLLNIFLLRCEKKMDRCWVKIINDWDYKYFAIREHRTYNKPDERGETFEIDSHRVSVSHVYICVLRLDAFFRLFGQLTLFNASYSRYFSVSINPFVVTLSSRSTKKKFLQRTRAPHSFTRWKNYEINCSSIW